MILVFAVLVWPTKDSSFLRASQFPRVHPLLMHFFVGILSIGASLSQPIVKEEEEEKEEEEKEKKLEEIVDLSDSQDEFEVFNRPLSPESTSADLDH